MELQGERLLPASIETTWAALNDPQMLKGCIANCESLEKSGDDTMDAVVAMKVGPVSARFKGRLTLTNVAAPNSYTIVFDGQGGMAGFGKGSADVALTPAGEGQTTLKYHARATVGGKIAQIGSRLIDSAAGKITNDFFTAFATQLEARRTTIAGGSTTEFGTAAGPQGLGDGTGPLGDAGAGSTGSGNASGVGGTPGAPGTQRFRVADTRARGGDALVVAPAAGGSAAPAVGGSAALDPAIVRLGLMIGGVVALAAVYFSIR